MSKIDVSIPESLTFLLSENKRFKVAYGGRGSGKSHTFASALVLKSMTEPMRILCTREFQNSITDSVHKLLCDLIYKYGLGDHFTITQHSIKNLFGSEFIFKGLRNNISEIKSIENIKICWVEEAAKVSKNSWEVLIPTIRAAESEIWITFNPDEKTDATYQMFVENCPPDCTSIKINYRDNPWFPEVLQKQVEYDKEFNYEKYMNIWEGDVRTISDAQIFKGKWIVKDFEEPNIKDIYQCRYFYGVDWGFSRDPCAAVRCFIQDRCLYITHEVYKVGVELNHLPQFLNSVPDIKRNKSYGDCSRPEIISYLKRHGYNIHGSPKWAKSVEEGIEYLKSFEMIVVHSRCKNVQDELYYYSYEVDRNTGDILTRVRDKHNHTIDALRYALADYIKRKVSILYNL